MAAMMPAPEPIRHPPPAMATSFSPADGRRPLDLRQLVREIPDFPKPGILFRDLTPLMRDPEGWQEVMRQLAGVCERLQPDLIVGIESRGFIVGTALATVVEVGFVPVRKPGKLPGAVRGVEYALEYGTDRLEIQHDALAGGPRVLIIDDLLATGGTAAACAELVGQAGGELCGYGFVAELAGLGGRQRLPGDHPVESLIVYS
jgi:adenine phosphoribosyltransferase